MQDASLQDVCIVVLQNEFIMTIQQRLTRDSYKTVKSPISGIEYLDEYWRNHRRLQQVQLVCPLGSV